ncbi:hypothetical protein SGPA1_80099 [Streptomyces misionensis JCM 4497]
MSLYGIDPEETAEALDNASHWDAANLMREMAARIIELETTDPAEHLATALERLNIPTIVAICGSTRFMTEMADADRALTWAGHIVVKPGCDMKNPHELWGDPAEAEAGKARLDTLHRAKIRLAHQVLVVGDYIGGSTRAEIEYARSLGKPVEFTHPAVDPAAEETHTALPRSISCSECGHPAGTHQPGDDPVTPGTCTACPPDDAHHDYQSTT